MKRYYFFHFFIFLGLTPLQSMHINSQNLQTPEKIFMATTQLQGLIATLSEEIKTKSLTPERKKELQQNFQSYLLQLKAVQEKLFESREQQHKIVRSTVLEINHKLEIAKTEISPYRARL